MKNSQDAPRIYVGTYGKYNEGSLHGKWFDLESFQDAESFERACRNFHSDESDAELMFQDWENIPSFLICEYFLNPDAFLYFQEAAQIDSTTADAFRLYCEHMTSWPEFGTDFETMLEGFHQSYQGYYGGAMKDPKTEFACQYIEDTGLLCGVPELLERYFDYEAFGRDMFLESYTELEGHVFLDC
jgi:antirestriction protein